MSVPKKIVCDVTDITKEFQKTQGPTVSISTSIDSLLEVANQFLVMWKEISSNCLHLHAKHYHPISNNAAHDVLEKDVKSKGCVMSTSKENLDTLSSEQNSFTDFNQTGMIFGRDYGFEYDSYLPRFYKMLHDSEVNPYYHTMKHDLRDFKEFVDIAMNNLYMNDDESCGYNYSTSSTSTLLITEFFKEIDLNNDELIYGVDFIIDDPSAPDELLQINLTNNIKENNPEIAVKTWEEYLKFIDSNKSLNPKESLMDKIKIQLSSFTYIELIDELILEFTTGNDVNNDDLIYGKDFLIVGDDKPFALNQYVPLYLPDIIMTWTTYCKFKEYNTKPDKQKYIDLLLSEYNQNLDMDGNGLIYGVDFVITDIDYFNNDDLNSIYSSNITIRISLSEYIKGIRPCYDNYVLDENIYAAKYTAEWLNNNDADGNNLIYSYHFILSDYEENKTECLWTIERYRNYMLKWTTDKINDLGLSHMISDYTQSEFDLYWDCSSDEPGTDENEIIVSEIDYTYPSDSKLLIPLNIHGIDLTDHIILFDGTYWYDLGFTLSYSGLYVTSSGDNIDLTGLSIDFTFDTFSDSSIYYIKNKSNVFPESPYVFKVNSDVRFRIYKTNRFFSIVDEYLDLNEVTISHIETLTESRNFIVTSDTRSNKNEPFNKLDLTDFMIRWFYNNETEIGNWILYNYYKTHLGHIILINKPDPYDECYVALHKQQTKFKFLPYVLNITWNDVN